MFGFVDNAMVDFLVTNRGGGGYSPEGEVAERLAQVRYDPGLMRPFIDDDGVRVCNVRTGRMVFNEKAKRREPEHKVIPIPELVGRGLVSPTLNASALPRLAWEMIDRAVIRATRDPLVAWGDMAAANTYGGFDGMGVEGLTRDTMTDPGQVNISMDGISGGEGDAMLFTSDILPLPIISCGFYFSQRRLAVSRNGGMPLDTTLAEAAGRRVSETLEQVCIGVTDLSTAVRIGSATDFSNRGVYGLVTHPDRITKTDLTAPTGSNPQAILNDVLTIIQLAVNQGFYGPYMLYHTRDFGKYMDGDYYDMTTSGAVAPTQTLRARIKQIAGIQDCKMLPLWTSTTSLLLVQMTGDTVRAVDGMAPTTVQWEEQGGAKIQLRVLCIRVPDIRSQYVRTSTSTRKAGIVHASTT